MQTIDYSPKYSEGSWGDSSGNRGNRMLATVAYLGATDSNGNLKPSVVMCRGYYTQAYVIAYDWDGSNLTQRFYNKSTSNSSSTLYGQGNHNLVSSDVDNDGYDEIVYGSAVLDNDGTVLSNTRLGHGDAMHVSDFNNDGNQEVFQVHEDSAGYASYGMDYRDAASGDHYFGVGASGDVGRGVMDNIDDAYASENSNGLALAWSSASDYAYDTAGNQVSARPDASSRTMTNSLLYWDGALDREILDDAIIAKYDASTGYTTRFYCGSSGSFSFGTNNDSKYNACISADLLGDWREEVVGRVGSSGEDQSLRVYISAIDTDYKLTTLMHDSQYRCGVATENVAYNQPPHLSYYVGSVALASSDANYLDPQTPFTNITYADVYNYLLDGEKTILYSEDFEGNSNSFSLINSSFSDYEYLEEDASTTNTKDGIVYGVGSRSSGDTGTQSSSIDTTAYNNANVSLDFKMDACAGGKGSNIALLGSPCTYTYLSSSSQILAISAHSDYNGYWATITINGEGITDKANVSNGKSNGESSGKGGLYRDTTGWIHMDAYLDFNHQTAYVTLKRISDGSIIYSDTVDFINSVDSLTNIYMAAGKSYGSVWLDDITVSGI